MGYNLLLNAVCQSVETYQTHHLDVAYTILGTVGQTKKKFKASCLISSKNVSKDLTSEPIKSYIRIPVAIRFQKINCKQVNV